MEWPLKDPEYIDFMQQYPSRLCKRTHMVLRKFAHGFIACKFSALAYLIIGILDKTKEEKIDMMLKIDIRRFGAFQNKRLENIFMKNHPDTFIEIHTFQDIVFEKNIALFGIVEDIIFHYFLMYKQCGFSIVSSYGSDGISIHQYETKVTPDLFIRFVKSLKKKDKTRTDQKRIRGFMRAHFLNPAFQVERTSMKDVHDEIERYVKSVNRVVQFPSILSAIQNELLNAPKKD